MNAHASRGKITEIEAADRYCRLLAKRHYENFSVASLVLPPSVRLHLARIYAFCRTTDDLGDESGDEGLSRLNVWQQQVESCLVRGQAPVHPVLLALRETVAGYRLPTKPFLDLIDANIQDQTVIEYESWKDLHDYCTRSAAPVGRMVLGVFGIQDQRAVELSDDVCIGLQLANFAQDVSIDRNKGRTYLIQSELRALGTVGAVQAMCDRAEHLLMSGCELEAMVSGRLRTQLALYRLGGLAIISAIRQVRYWTDVARPRVSSLTKIGLLTAAVASGTRRRMYAPAEHPA